MISEQEDDEILHLVTQNDDGEWSLLEKAPALTQSKNKDSVTFEISKPINRMELKVERNINFRLDFSCTCRM